MIRMLVVDDDPLVRSGIAMLLAAEHDVSIVGEAGDGLVAVESAGDLAPDIVLMDLGLPLLAGTEAIRRIADSGAGRPRVLALTTFDDDETVVRALRAGADGFLVKDSAPTRLGEAVRAVAAGRSWLDPAVTSPVLDTLRRQQPWERPGDGNPLADLTPRELDVLRLMAHGLSNREIGEAFVVSEATVRTHVSRILTKTDSRDRTQAVVLAYRCGAAPIPAFGSETRP